MPPAASALLTDLYQLNMLAAYVEHGLTEIAAFELFVRKLPARRGFLLAAGLEQVLSYLENLAFTPEDIARFRREHRLTMPIIPDPNGWLASRFNAVWTPRAYVVTGAGRMLWIQKRIAMSPEAVEQAVRGEAGIYR